MRASCLICTELFDGTQDVSAVQCGHTFHDKCLEEWLRQSLTCPQCRERVDRRKVIHKLYFNQAGDEEGQENGEAVSRLRNQLETVQASLKLKDKEKGDLLVEHTLLSDKIDQLRDNYK